MQIVRTCWAITCLLALAFPMAVAGAAGQSRPTASVAVPGAHSAPESGRGPSPTAPLDFAPASPSDELRNEAYRPAPAFEEMPVETPVPVQDDTTA